LVALTVLWGGIVFLFCWLKHFLSYGRACGLLACLFITGQTTGGIGLEFRVPHFPLGLRYAEADRQAR
jgi:hypothetical protein